MKLERPKQVRRIMVVISVIFLVGLAVFLILVATRDLPDVEAEVTFRHEEKPLVLEGLNSGQAGIGSNSEVKAIYGGDESAPIASLAKVITSAVMMERESDLDKIITLDEIDVGFYEEAVRTGGSRLWIVAEEQLTLRQMHEALLIISANNIADSLVYHLFGDFDNYKIAAEEWLNKNGLSNTVIGLDASGLDPSTVSSPSDMIKIGQIVLQNTEISQIVRQTTVSFPLESIVRNTNTLLDDGYYGIKTGNTLEAGSCLLFATEYDGEEIIGVLMGQPFYSTFDTAKFLVEQVVENFSVTTIPAGMVVGKYDLPWSGTRNIITTDEISAKTWGDADVEIDIKPYKQNSYSQGVGTLKMANKEINLKIESQLTEASMSWRLTHLNQLKW